MNPNHTPQSDSCLTAPQPHSSRAHSVSTRSAPEHAPSELSDRLIPLCDGRPGLRATLQIQAQAEPPSGAPANASPLPVIDFVSSDATLDRYDEIISPAGWRLDNYRRNPVFQNAHQYGDIIFTLGKALITEVRTSPFLHLFQRIEFAVDVNPMARIAYGLYKNKFLNAVSVGFIPIRWEDGDGTPHTLREFSDVSRLQFHSSNPPFHEPGDKTASSPQPSPPAEERGRLRKPARFIAATRQAESRLPLEPDWRVAGSDGSLGCQVRRTYLEQELLEVSAVGIPANPEALQLGLKAGAIDRTDLKALLEALLENGEGRMRDAESPAESVTASGLDSSSIHSTIHSPTNHVGGAAAMNLLQLACALRELLRRT